MVRMKASHNPESSHRQIQIDPLPIVPQSGVGEQVSTMYLFRGAHLQLVVIQEGCEWVNV